MLWFRGLGALLLLGGVVPQRQAVDLPDTSGISGQLTSNLTVDQFFGLWMVFNDGVDAHISDKPYTILAPQNKEGLDTSLSKPAEVRQLLLDHVVLGQKLRLDDVVGALHFRTLGGKVVSVQEINGTLYANSARVVEPRVDVAGGGVLVVLDDYLFPSDALSPADPTSDSTFFQNLVDLLSFFKNGVMVFQHFLARSNVSRLLSNDKEYTVLIPTDGAFQRWHPIDWGFYPFSVPEFTESVIINHFIPGNLRQEDIQDGQKATTLGGREVVFTKNPFFMTANGAPIVQGDTPIHHGNLIFVSEVLFVSDAEVQALHQKHKDKETPPLLAFPWFGAQFLSHAFLALERQRQFTHITRFLNMADLAAFVPAKNYTFFVPVDSAFEELGLGKVPDNYFTSKQGLHILLSHFVKGRLYQRDLRNGTKLTTLSNQEILITQVNGTTYANDAIVATDEVFVYNLGTMFYVNKVLFATPETLPPIPETTSTSAPSIPPLVFTDPPSLPTTPEDVELFTKAQEIAEQETEVFVTRGPLEEFPEVILQDETAESGETTTFTLDAVTLKNPK